MHIFIKVILVKSKARVIFISNTQRFLLLFRTRLFLAVLYTFELSMDIYLPKNIKNLQLDIQIDTLKLTEYRKSSPIVTATLFVFNEFA